ncbi:DNA methyltransferase [Mesorhizobium sp. M1A.F.Ca.IN.020.03.2.1]|uniref:DNA-methyltransferase n=1 Tax=Mesorhizobium sp. M1A.F.Ca.IN.020.03.2.1 TaxID=2496769 RepID=UPI001FE1E4FD|nr:DNA methyltransferase [Mesorhizobium sp. M1A.F.Ca.IN.020.03.2.1]
MADSMTPYIMDQASGPDWHLYHGDCVDVVRGLPENSLHYTIFSPPFESLYTFSDDPRDMSNCRDSETFWTHFRFLIVELYRATMPGRLVSIHCMQLPTSKLRDGYIGLRDFRGEIIREFQQAGFIYHSETCIRKDPVSAMQRTKAIGLLHKQVVKDSSLSRCAVADYVVDLRKPGENPEPIAGALAEYHGDDMSDAEHDQLVRRDFKPEGGRRWEDHKSIMVWQRYAEPVWTDIAQSDVLSHRVARVEADERHISPLQLTVIRRRVDLYSNPGDVVFSPFAGIGSELYVAIELGRRGLGAEIKQSYFRQAVDNLRSAQQRVLGLSLVDAPSIEPTIAEVGP